MGNNWRLQWPSLRDWGMKTNWCRSYLLQGKESCMGENSWVLLLILQQSVHGIALLIVVYTAYWITRYYCCCMYVASLLLCRSFVTTELESLYLDWSISTDTGCAGRRWVYRKNGLLWRCEGTHTPCTHCCVSRCGWMRLLAGDSRKVQNVLLARDRHPRWLGEWSACLLRSSSQVRVSPSAYS